MSCKWKFEKLQGDAAIYAFCPICNYYYNSGNAIVGINLQYRYCPMCGKHLYVGETEFEVAWNERSISVLHQEETKDD